MINLTSAQLRSVQMLYGAIDQLGLLLKYYSENKPGPAYLHILHHNDAEIQLDRAIMLTALRAQLAVYYSSLQDLGISYAKTE